MSGGGTGAPGGAARPELTVALHVGQLVQPVPGGIGRYVEHLVAHLPGAGVAVTPFSAGTPPRPPARHHDLGQPHGSARYELWHRLRRPVVRVPGDLVHAPSLAVPPPGRRPLVVTVHDVAFLRHPDSLTGRGVAFHRRGLALTRREAAAVVVPSRFVAGELAAEGVDPERVHVVHHGVDAPPFGRAHRVEDARPYLLFVGTVEPRKGIDVLVEAYRALRPRHPDLRLVVAGAAGWGEPPDLSHHGVVPLGGVDDATLDALYRGAVATVLPSRYEGFGMPLLEAMARGCPVIATDSSSLPEVVADAGLLVPVGDVDALAGAIERVLDDMELRWALGDAGRARAARFTWSASAAGHRAAYEAALAA